MSFRSETKRLLADFRKQRPLRSGSLIITLFGDAIAPRGGTVWLGSLIPVLEPFGLDARLVRTSVRRLVKDDWLEAHPVGRRSYYSLTAGGRRRFESATRRIYSRPDAAWDGQWSLIILPARNLAQRDQLKKELSWLGYGSLTTGVLAHPAADTEAVQALLRELNVSDSVLVLGASQVALTVPATLSQVVRQCWDLDDLEQRYHAFLDRFRPVYRAMRGTRLEPEAALQLRTLLIHEYRKITLRDPHLPLELLPANWSGTAAYTLCRNLYSRVQPASEQFLSAELETADGPLPEPTPQFFERFGGLVTV